VRGLKSRHLRCSKAAVVETDAIVFETLATSEKTSDLRRAAALYGGDLLEGFSVRDPGFDEWLTIERERLSPRHRRARKGVHP